MKNRNIVIVLAATVALLLALLVAGIVVWWQGGAPAAPGHPADPASAPANTANHKYVSLDKVIVMLRGKDGEPLSHYLAMDLVLKVREEDERTVKEHLPLLRSVAVKSMSTYTLEKAGMMTIDQFTADINRAFSERYRQDRRDKPFVEAMVSKLIIE